MSHIVEILKEYQIFLFLTLFIVFLVILILFFLKKKSVNNKDNIEKLLKKQNEKEKIDISGTKWIGKREIQEDAYAIFSQSEKEHLLIIADGMGGHSDGQLASQFSIDRFLDLYTKEDLEIPEIIRKINTELLNFSENVVLKNEIGTTFLVCEIKENKAKIFSVGDSSIYMITDEIIRQLNKHQEKEKYLTNYIGYENFDNEGINVAEINLEEINRDEKGKKTKIPAVIFMCSDGVDKYIGIREVKRIVIENIKKSSDEIVELVLKRLQNERKLKQDNASIILIKADV